MKSKLLDWERMGKTAGKLREAGKRIVFTNGCFDILHAGHVRYLSAAKTKGDFLFLGVNSDVSVRSIKGERRPVIEQEHRGEVLCALSCVDYLTFFDDPDPLELIRRIRPHVLVKGADWPEEKIVGANFVKSMGGCVERIDLVPAVSTTQIIERIVRIYSKDLP